MIKHQEIIGEKKTTSDLMPHLQSSKHFLITLEDCSFFRPKIIFVSQKQIVSNSNIPGYITWKRLQKRSSFPKTKQKKMEKYKLIAVHSNTILIFTDI